MDERQVFVVEDHEVPDRAPIQIEVGDVVDVGEQDRSWPAFVFITTDDGSGWVPERNLDDSRPTAQVIEAYDTTELTATAGDELIVLIDDDYSGWSWCRSEDGSEGWVPHSVLG